MTNSWRQSERFYKSINQPGLTDVHINQPLSQIAIAHFQQAGDFVASEAFPTILVRKKTNSYFTLPKGKLLMDEMEIRAPGSLSVERTHDVSNDSYSCDVWALHEKLADEVRENYDSPLQPEAEITQGLVQAALIRRERQWVTDYFGTSIWTGDQTGVDSASPGANQFGRWDRADSEPIETIRTGKRTVQARSGFRPNTLVMGREVYDALLDHPDIVGRLDRGQTSGTAIVMRQNLAELFELDRVLVMDGIYNSAVEGASDSLGFIGGKSALLCYSAPNPGLYVPSAGYTFAWSQFGGVGMQTRRLRDEKRQSTMIELQMAFDFKKVEADLGLFYATAVN